MVLMEAGERVPADMILLRTSDEGGTVFIRTDQLDGETVAIITLTSLPLLSRPKTPACFFSLSVLLGEN